MKKRPNRGFKFPKLNDEIRKMFTHEESVMCHRLQHSARNPTTVYIGAGHWWYFFTGKNCARILCRPAQHRIA